MITFKQSGDEAPGGFQAQINRQPVGFWVKAETAKEAEQKFFDYAADGANIALRRLQFEKAQKQLIEKDDLIVQLKDRVAELKDEIDGLKESARQLKETITKMKTEVPEAEKYNSRRIFRRW